MKQNSRWCSNATPSDIGNYFLSVWMANLGVVPLFFICFLRVEPILTFLFDLLVFVTRVLETILILLLDCLQNKPLVLSKTAVPVKTFLGVLICFGLQKPLAMAQNQEIDLILARGEQKELNFPQGIRKYSLGNSEVLAKKVMGKSLLIKGKSVGFSDLKVWHSNKGQSHFRVYVLSKSDQLTSLQLGEAVKDLKLKLKVSGSFINIEGEINKIEDYKLIRKILQTNQDLIIDNVELSKTLKGHIIGKIYEFLFKENLESFRCQNHFLKIECLYSEEQKISEPIQKMLKDKFMVDFVPIKEKAQNYQIKLKLIQLERLDGLELSLGLNQLSSKVENFFQQGLMSLVNQNLILLRHHNMHASTLAEPIMLSVLGEESKVEIGSEIPYRADALNAINTQWKFAGLKLKFTLVPHGKTLKLKYETEFTRPQEGNISGSKNQALVHVQKNVPLEIFQIVFKTQTEEKSGIPVIESIPLLGEIFKSKSNVVTYKSITGILLVEEKI
ncbi:MAG: pilus assembly protein N-terminal domain-containing protein [Bacteriovoracaceae bacterium]